MQFDGGKSPRGFVPAYLLLAAPLVAGAFFSSGWTWGWDHLNRASLAWRFAVSVLAVLLWAPGVRRGVERAAVAVGDRLSRRPLQSSVLISLAGLLLFAIFPIATRIYGDSRYILDDHTGASLAVHLRKMLSFGLQARGSASFVLHDLLARATGLSYERSYMVVSTLCGGLFLLAHARLSGTIPGISPVTRAVILWLGITDGANQLFFGHVENYTIPRLFACLFLIEVVRSLLDPARPLRRARALLWLVLAIFFHAQWLILLPTALLWVGRDLAQRRRTLRPWVGARAMKIGLGAILAATVLAYLAAGSYCYDYIYSGGRPHPRQIFLPATTACIGAPYLRYTLFSAGHLADWIGSLYSISSPAILLPLLLLLPGALRRERPRDGGAPAGPDGGAHVLLPALVLGFLHNFILNSAIGFPFDWDLLSVISPPLLYTAVFLAGRAGSIPPAGGGSSAGGGASEGGPASAGRTASGNGPASRAGLRAPNPLLASSILPGILFLGLGSLTLFGINASPARVYRRVEDMGVWLHRSYFGGSHYRLSSNLSTVADPAVQARERARVLARLMPDAYPGDWEIAFLWERLAIERIKVEDYAGAKEAYENAIKVQPSKWQFLKPLGYLESEIGDVERGIRLLEEYLEDAPNDPEGWLLLGDAGEQAGQPGISRKGWSRFLELMPAASEAAQVRERLERLDQSLRAP